MLLLVFDQQVVEVRTLEGWETRFPPGSRGKGSRAVLRVLKRRKWVTTQGTGKATVNQLILTDEGRKAAFGRSS